MAPLITTPQPTECQILPDGRANLRGVGIKQVILRKAWVAEVPSYHGLWLATLAAADLVGMEGGVGGGGRGANLTPPPPTATRS